METCPVAAIKFTGEIPEQKGDKGYKVIAGGFNIYLREVDDVLYQHPKVAEGVTGSIPDSYRGDTVKVFIVLKTGQTATQKEMITFCKEKMAPYKVPKPVGCRKSIPKSAVGKILRKILRDEEIAKTGSIKKQINQNEIF